MEEWRGPGEWLRFDFCDKGNEISGSEKGELLEQLIDCQLLKRKLVVSGRRPHRNLPLPGIEFRSSTPHWVKIPPNSRGRYKTSSVVYTEESFNRKVMVHAETTSYKKVLSVVFLLWFQGRLWRSIISLSGPWCLYLLEILMSISPHKGKGKDFPWLGMNAQSGNVMLAFHRYFDIWRT